MIRQEGILIRQGGILIRQDSILIRQEGILIRQEGILIRQEGIRIRQEGILIRQESTQRGKNDKLAKTDLILRRMRPSDAEFHAEFEFNTPGAIWGQESMVIGVFHVRGRNNLQK